MRLLVIFIMTLLVMGHVMPACALELRDVTFKTKELGPVLFSHNVHITVGKQKNDCRACHDKLFDMKHPVRHTMADMGQGKSCGACHDGKSAFPLATCAKCHPVKNIARGSKGSVPVVFTHQEHAARQSCSVCHPAIFAAGKNRSVGMAAMEKGKSCGACHDGGKAFALNECARCHTIKDISFKVRETGPVAFTHKAHAERQKCSLCHPKIYTYAKSKRVGMAAMIEGRSCGACHNGKAVFALGECSRCHPVKELTFPVSGISAARFSHTVHLAKYGCSICHPKLYQLKRGAPVGMTAMEKGKSCGACHNGKAAFSVTASCGFCH